MTEEGATRKVAAILCANVAGYSRLTQADEIGTHRQLSVSLDLVTDRIRNAGERVMQFAGHAPLAVVESVVAATNCAIGTQYAISAQRWFSYLANRPVLGQDQCGTFAGSLNR